jgi:hypothetical protein
MMAYHVIRTINGRRYRYLQRSVREGRKVRSEYVYLGPVDDEPQSFTEELKNMVRTSYEFTEEQERQQFAQQQAEYAQCDRVNELLTAETITLQGINEIADAQAEKSPAGEGEASATGAGGSEGAQ